MPVITGGARDYYVSDEDILNAFAVLPNTNDLDYTFFVRDIIAGLKNQNDRLTFLMVLCAFRGTEISTILNVSKQQVYKKHMVNVKKVVEKVKKNYATENERQF